MLTIIYMAPGGYRQWPMSQHFLIVYLQTRALALSTFQAAVQKNPKWKPRYRCGPKVAVAPPSPFKFLDIGTKMGCYKIGDRIPVRKDTTNIPHPRFVGNGIPPANTFLFYAAMHERAAKWIPDGEVGLPVIVPTCPKKLFALGPRKKYVDIVTDTLHASSSDLITWNTLVMMKLQWIDLIPREWIEITTQSLEAWKARDEQSP